MMKTDASSVKKSILFLMPMLFVVFVAMVTIILFRFGTIHWNVDNMTKTVLYVFAIYAAFAGGYILYYYKWVKRRNGSLFEVNCSRIIKVMFWVGVIVGILYNAIFTISMLGDHWYLLTKYPGAAYDYFLLIARIGDANDFAAPMFVRFISWAHLFVNGLTFFALSRGLFAFKSAKRFEKIAWVALFASFIFHGWFTGKQSFVFILIFLIVSFVILRVNTIIKSNSFHKGRKIIALTAFFLIACVFCVGVMYLFQSDRSVQREIRTQLTKPLVDSGQEITEDEWNIIVAESINIRLGYQLVPPNIDSSETRKKLTKLKDIDYDEYGENENFGSDFMKAYTTDKNSSRLYKLSHSAYYAEQAIELYATQGYYGLSMAFDRDFSWTYFIGNSRFLTSFIDEYFGTEIYSRTYPAKNEIATGYDSKVYFNSLYAWLASDFTFPGVIVLFFFIGMLFALAWREASERKNPFAFAFFFFMIFGLMMASCTNSLLSDMATAWATFTIALLFAVSVIYRKRKERKLKNAQT
jgi:hypothetical protein